MILVALHPASVGTRSIPHYLTVICFKIEEFVIDNLAVWILFWFYLHKLARYL